MSLKKQAKWKRPKKTTKMKPKELVLHYSRFYPHMDLNKIYGCVLQFNRNEDKIAEELIKIDLLEQKERKIQILIKEIQSVYPSITNAVARIALEKNKMLLEDSLSWVIEKNMIEKCNAKESDTEIIEKEIEITKNPTERLVLTHSKILKKMKTEFNEINERNKKLDEIVNHINTRINKIVSVVKNYKTMHSSLIDSVPEVEENRKKNGNLNRNDNIVHEDVEKYEKILKQTQEKEDNSTEDVEWEDSDDEFEDEDDDFDEEENLTTSSPLC